MLRTMIAAVAAGMLVAPASAQTVELLTADAWECRMSSLVGNPSANVMLSFTEPNAFYAVFRLEMPTGEDILSVEFDMSGAWTLEDDLIRTTATGSDLVGVWLNDEEVAAETMAEIKEGMADELSSFVGESAIAYIAEHAMVLDEPDASVSCWR